MRRKIMIVLLSLGTIGGFASGAASMRWRGECRRQAFEQRVARVCVDAARAAEADAKAAEATQAARAAEPAQAVEAAQPAQKPAATDPAR
jgi:hypothetical protein